VSYLELALGVKPEEPEPEDTQDKGVPTPDDKDFFRAVLIDARIARYVGADAEGRKVKLLAQLAQPGVTRAMALSPGGTLTVGVKSDGIVWTQELIIPAEKFDPWLILERFEKATLQ
jgi:hypothetical protein